MLKKELRRLYGEDAVKKYICLRRGIPIGNYFETMVFLKELSDAKKSLRKKSILFRIKEKLFY